MSTMVRTAAAIALSALFAPNLASGQSPTEMAAENKALAEKFAKSVVTVRYYTRKADDGDESRLMVSYICPNCGNAHWRSANVNPEKGIPAEFVGFVVGPDTILMQDIDLRPEFVDRIEILCGDATVPAMESEYAPGRNALFLKAERPIPGAVPLTFGAPGVPKAPKFFMMVREDGVTVASTKKGKADDFKYYPEIGKCLYDGLPNTLVLGDNGEPATVSLRKTVEVGDEDFSSPASWGRRPAAERFEKADAMERRLRRAILPVYVQLESKPKDGLSRAIIRWSSSEDVPNDIDTVGVAIGDSTILVLANMKQEATARISKIEATLPDGRKARLSFVGSYADRGAFAARLEDAGDGAGLEPLALDRRSAVEYFGKTLLRFSAINNSGDLKFKGARVEVSGFSRARGNATVPEFSTVSGWEEPFSNARNPCRLVVSDGGVAALGLPARSSEHSSWRHDDEYMASGQALFATIDSPVFDKENIPRDAKDRKRTAWLGVEVQLASPETIRDKKATGYIHRYTTRPPMVSGVASNSPAAAIGLREGDILLSVRRVGGDEERLSLDDDAFEDNWAELFDTAGFAEYAGSGELMPWPNLEGGVNRVFTAFGVGTEVVVSWVRDGKRMEGTARLALAPVHYANAPRSRDKALGMTVADMTDEVRKFFKLEGDAPGVVVSKVKSGGPAAVAGILPLELVIDVNGEGVASARDFVEKTRGKKDLTFSVRRLSATRVVPIKLQ